MTRLTLGNVTLDLSSDGKQYVAILSERTFRVDLVDATDGRYELLVDGRRLVAYVSEDPRSHWVTIAGRTFRIGRSSKPIRPSAAHRGPAELVAPMPGQVRTVNVAAGDIVSKGQLLVVMEAMKMEIRVSAPFDAQVVSVEVRVDQTVDREQIIARLQAH